MKIISEGTLALFRGPGVCEACRQWCRRREAAHVFTRGMGGGGRIDLSINLLSLGDISGCCCHANHHAGLWPTRDDLVDIVARREKTTSQAIKDAIRDIRRLSRFADKNDLAAVLKRAGANYE